MIKLEKTAIVTKILKPTKAKLFRDLKVGDTLQFSVDLKRAGDNKGSTYATYIVVIFNGEKIALSFNQLANRLDCFELKEFY